MKLTREEKLMLDGKFGKSVKKAIEILIALGKIYNAERMVRIGSAQISGISYKNIGDAGIEFLEEFLSDAKVRVKATINPCGMDTEKWKSLKISNKFAEKQFRIINLFKKIGVGIDCSCTPYLIGNKPGFNEHIAWSESSAIVYANSVLGARTNRESGISALAAAITGRTPMYGYHLDENRRANFLINVKCKLESISDFAALGYIVGNKIGNNIPYFRGIERVDWDKLKALGASMAASGAIALYHIENITPEAKIKNMLRSEFREITIESIDDAYIKLNSTRDREIDLVAIGCPHLSINEIEYIANLLKDKKVVTKLWLMTSRKTMELAMKRNLIERIVRSGAEVISDTCLLVMPIENLKIKTIATNSGKLSFYLPSYCNIDVRFGSIEKCIRSALTGVWDD